MSTDVRGFNYALEPLLRRQRWELEALQARLGIANREMSQAQLALDELHDQLQEQHAKVSGAVLERMDPGMHRRSLYWLVQLRGQVLQAQDHLDSLRQQRSELLREHADRQNKLSVMERHRGDCLADYAREQESRVAAAADSDWLARRKLPALKEARP